MGSPLGGRPVCRVPGGDIGLRRGEAVDRADPFRRRSLPARRVVPGGATGERPSGVRARRSAAASARRPLRRAGTGGAPRGLRRGEPVGSAGAVARRGPPPRRRRPAMAARSAPDRRGPQRHLGARRSGARRPTRRADRGRSLRATVAALRRGRGGARVRRGHRSRGRAERARPVHGLGARAATGRWTLRDLRPRPVRDGADLGVDGRGPDGDPRDRGSLRSRTPRVRRMHPRARPADGAADRGPARDPGRDPRLGEIDEVVEERTRGRRVDPVGLVGRPTHRIAEDRDRDEDAAMEVRTAGIAEARAAAPRRRVHAEVQPRPLQRQEALLGEPPDPAAGHQRVRALPLRVADLAVADGDEPLRSQDRLPFV